MVATIKAKIETLWPSIVAHRRHLHTYPELSFNEEKTAAYVAKNLQLMGISFTPNVAGHGIVATIQGNTPTSSTIVLRADMDALPITEQNQVPYASKNPGIMHACGHDAHTASLLGAAAVLQSEKAHFSGAVRLIFQPAEEVLPGGASLMIKAGVLENPAPSGVIGQHVMPLIPAGKVGFRSGKYMASTDELTLKVYGKGGHAAMPHLNVDTLLITSHIIVALQQVVSRWANPTLPTVLSFGKINSDGGAYNVIPNSITALGTFRTLDEQWRTEAHQIMERIATQTAQAMGGRCELQINRGYPALYNNPTLTAKCKNNAINYLGEDNVVDLDLWMAAEDFAYYSQVAPSCFYRLGTRNEAMGITSSVHTPTFDIDESALKIGAGLMAYNAIQLLNN